MTPPVDNGSAALLHAAHSNAAHNTLTCTAPSRGAVGDVDSVFAWDTVSEELQCNAVQIFREETFGPAIPLFRFGSEAEAIQLANDTEYGLASYFFTKVRR